MLGACNGPPLYNTRAEEFLRGKNINPDLIHRLQTRGQLTEAEADQLSSFSNIPVLHLVASNPTTPERVLVRLAKHESFEVITGLVSNPATPLYIVLKFRTPGKYTTVNDYMARNPNLPVETFKEMFQAREVGYVSPALNPNCPPEVMWRIYQEGGQIAQVWLATNPNLPSELVERIAKDNDPLVMQRLRANPVYSGHERKK